MNEYKIHYAVYNGEEQPLDVFVKDQRDWQGWNEWKGNKDDFNRKYIFSLIKFYPQDKKWLFGGIFEVIERYADRYELKLLDLHKSFIGRLLIDYQGVGSRGRSFLFEHHYSKLNVAEVFESEYSGEIFCGFDQVQHSFDKLEHIIRNQKKDWKRALSSVKGVYLIVDKSNGLKYVGSAYGDQGIWSRWENYVYTGHGWNEGLSLLLAEHGMNYARENFQFSILDFYSNRTDDKIILERESHWKRVLCTRAFGYNKN